MRIYWVIDGLMQRGISQEAIQARVPFPITHDKEGEFKKASVDCCIDLLNWGAEQLNEPDLALKLPASSGPYILTPESLSFIHAPTLRHWATGIDQAQELTSPAFEIEFRDLGDICTLSWRLNYPTSSNPRQLEEAFASIGIEVMSRGLGIPTKPERIDFSHPRPESTDTHHSLFGAHVYFDMPIMKIYAKTELFDRPLAERDINIYEAFEKQTNEELKKLDRKNFFFANLNKYVLKGLIYNCLSIEWVAQQMFISSRSLERRLQEAGTSFRAVKKQIIMETAKSALTDSEQTLSTIAINLGYSELSAFSRAFKNATGYSPRDYSKLQQKQRAELR